VIWLGCNTYSYCYGSASTVVFKSKASPLILLPISCLPSAPIGGRGKHMQYHVHKSVQQGFMVEFDTLIPEVSVSPGPSKVHRQTSNLVRLKLLFYPCV